MPSRSELLADGDGTWRGHLWLAQIVAQRLSEISGRAIEVPGECDSWPATSARHLRWLASGGYLRRRPFARPVRPPG